MCGRFYVEEDEALEERILRLNRGAILKMGDIHPSRQAAVLLQNDKLTAETFRWGFPGRDGKLLINARSESAAQRPSFRELWRSCRLLIPAHAYYEWDAAKTKHTLGTGSGMYLAGLYRPNERSFVILTREAAPGIRFIHDRMPVIFQNRAARDWLNPENDPSRVLLNSETERVRPLTQQMRLDV